MSGNITVVGSFEARVLFQHIRTSSGLSNSGLYIISGAVVLVAVSAVLFLFIKRKK